MSNQPQEHDCNHVSPEVIEWMKSLGFEYTTDTGDGLKFNHKLFVSKNMTVFAEQAKFFHTKLQAMPVPSEEELDDDSLIVKMKLLGFDPVETVYGFTLVMEVPEDSPHLTNGKSYWQLSPNQARKMLQLFATLHPVSHERCQEDWTLEGKQQECNTIWDAWMKLDDDSFDEFMREENGRLWENGDANPKPPTSEKEQQ